MKWFGFIPLMQWEDTNMSIWGKLFNKSSKKSSNKWVFIGSNDFYTDYYDSTSVEINSLFFTVTCNRVYTNKAKKRLSDYRETLNISNDMIPDIHHSLYSYDFDYKGRKNILLMAMHVSKSGAVLGDWILTSLHEMDDIKPGTADDLILNKILKDYNIQR
jgi:hypothetical protein